MASCSFTHQGRTFTLTVEETSYSIANNTSDVKWTLSITGGGGYYNTSYARVVVNGVERYNSGQVSWETGRFPAADGSKSGTVTGIGHNSEGKATISFQVQGYSYVYSTQTANGSLKLTDIPRASVPTCNNTTLGTAVTINTNRYVSSFSHTIKIKQGSTVVENIAKFTTATKSWTPEIATYAPLITNSPTGTFTIELETFNGNTSIGTKTCSVVLTVPSSVKPTASISISEGDSTVSAKGWGVYVKGKSKLAVTITGTEAYSSEINNYYSIIEGVPYTSNSYTSNVLNVVGSGSVVANVTDKRGTTSADATKSYTVVDYAKPAITTAIAVRCNASGVETDEGTYMKYTFVGAIAAVSNKNTKRFRIRWKLKSSTTWGTNDYVDIETSSYTCNKAGQILTKGSTKVSFASTSSYDIQFMATDAFETTTIDKTFDTGFDLINLHASGKSLAIGKTSEANATDKKLEIGLDAYFIKDIYLKGNDLKNVIKKVVLDTYYPIGKTYITMGNEDPNETIGGTWIKVSGGYLYATSTSLSQTSFDGWGTQSGGNGNSGSTTLTASQSGLPRHEHDMYDRTYGGYTNNMGIRGDGGGGSHKIPTYSQTDGWSTYKPAPAGGDDASEGHTHTIPAHSHDIATIDIFMWKRTA